MAYEFFFSYTRSNNDAYLKRFFKDLSEDIRGKLGFGGDVDVGFFDQRDIERGSDWDATIVSALQNSKVLLAVASPGYFKKEYCGKEWELFRLRCAAAADATGKAPPLLKSIVWIEYPIDPLPPPVRALQLYEGDPAAIHNTKGLRFMLLQIAKQRTAYRALVDRLGSEIIAAGAQHPIGPLPDVPALSEVPSAFHPPPPRPPSPGEGAVALAPIGPLPPGPIATVFSGPSGPKHVHFVFVAAAPKAFGLARTADPYVDAGAGDWKPFYPDDMRRVSPMLQYVAARDDLQFSSAEVQFDADLMTLIDKALLQRQIVVIVVDPWSVHWDAQQAAPTYQALLRQLDTRLDYHWCVLVPWNEHDAALTAERDEINFTVRDTFERHAGLLPMFYREGIASAAELQSTVAEVLTRLKEEINKRAPVQRPVPSGTVRPVVTGPSALGASP